MPPSKPISLLTTDGRLARYSSRIRPIPKTPLWKGPYEDGITFSLLAKFLVCRERFRLQVIEGLTERGPFERAIEFGSMWHTAEEHHSAGKPWSKPLQNHYQQLLADYPEDSEIITTLYLTIKTAFPLYVDYWQHHQTERNRQPIAEEQEFRLPYTLPSGRTVTLRGKIDGIFAEAPSIYAQENKTKGKIDEEGISKTLFGNLQTMFYQTALSIAKIEARRGYVAFDFGMGPGGYGTGHKGYLIKHLKDNQEPVIAGVLYNVVKRPLEEYSKHCIRKRKGETVKAFYDRLRDEVIRQNPEDFFMRWKCILGPADPPAFEQRIFNPILEQLMDWWEWITCPPGPFDPWSDRKLQDLCPNIEGVSLLGPDAYLPNKLHWQAPWGVYNSLGLGFRGDFFNYLTSGKTENLSRVTNLFPELS